MRITTFALGLLVAAFGTYAHADGNAADGKKWSEEKQCHTCHGADGNKTLDPQYPRLAGQYADYLAKSLREYRSGTRENAVMAGFATQLDEQQIEDLALYYSQQKGELEDLSHLK